MPKPNQKRRKLTPFVTIGRLGGRVSSPAKAAAARANGAKGGRPRKATPSRVCAQCGEPEHGTGVGWFDCGDHETNNQRSPRTICNACGGDPLTRKVNHVR